MHVEVTATDVSCYPTALLEYLLDSNREMTAYQICKRYEAEYSVARLLMMLYPNIHYFTSLQSEHRASHITLRPACRACSRSF